MNLLVYTPRSDLEVEYIYWQSDRHHSQLMQATLTHTRPECCLRTAELAIAAKIASPVCIGAVHVKEEQATDNDFINTILELKMVICIMVETSCHPSGCDGLKAFRVKWLRTFICR